MAEAGSGAAGGYVAFISYSHKDAAIGRWLHRKLEGYRLPKRLAGTEGEDGEVPARLTPIFRDRDELPAAGDLSERVRAALAVSKNLIVVCSPNSAASPWVAKEIATFRELHPGRPIFTAIVEGEPGQCFSPALLEGGVEPLAADLRKEGDGRRLGLLKLVSGLAGVGLDALVQRDAQRKVRRVTYVTVAAVAAMLVMALLTAFALNARAEAERQRAEAEGLVEFMLTDLREKLRGAVRIAVMQDVNRRALAYYGSGRDLRDASLALRARILQATGDDYIDLENAERAMVAYKEAQKTTAELVKRDPSNPQWLFDDAKTLSGIGRAYEIRRDYVRADHYFTAFAAAAQRLLKFAPHHPDYLLKAASAFIDLGNLRLRRTDDYPGAQRSYEQAISYVERAAASRPKDHHVLLIGANAFGGLADTYFYRGDWPNSLAARRNQYRLAAAAQQEQQELNRRNRQLGRPEGVNGDILFALAGAGRGIACALLELGREDEGYRRLREAYAATEALARIEDKKAAWQVLREKLALDLGQFRGIAPAVNGPRRPHAKQSRCVTSKPVARPAGGEAGRHGLQ